MTIVIAVLVALSMYFYIDYEDEKNRDRRLSESSGSVPEVSSSIAINGCDIEIDRAKGESLVAPQSRTT